jgi:hypothetical protein
MKRIFILLVMLPTYAGAAESHWCEKSPGIGGNYPVCPAGYTQKDGDKYVAPAIVEKITPHIGMTADDALRADRPWGSPNYVNTSTTARGVREQWVYTYGHRYLYFENGMLTSISE